jgi:hypothetical protein
VAIFSIPKDDREGFVLLRDISEEAFNQLLLTLEADEPDYSSVKGLTPQQAERIKDSIHTASFVRVSADVSLERFVNDLCESLLADDNSFFRSSDEQRFRERAARILGSESIVVIAKALTLRSEHERQFCRARILTDARPVYADDPSAPPAAMVITQTLKIEYHGAGGRLHEIYLGIGPDGISELMDVLDRARKKTKSLEAALEGSNMVLIDPQSEREN